VIDSIEAASRSAPAATCLRTPRSERSATGGKLPGSATTAGDRARSPSRRTPCSTPRGNRNGGSLGGTFDVTGLRRHGADQPVLDARGGDGRNGRAHSLRTSACRAAISSVCARPRAIRGRKTAAGTGTLAGYDRSRPCASGSQRNLQQRAR
jgi:hypothetical protein